MSVKLTAFRSKVFDVLRAEQAGQSLSTGVVCDRVFGETSGKRAGGAMEATTKALIYLCQVGLAGNFQTSSGRFVYSYWFAQEKGG